MWFIVFTCIYAVPQFVLAVFWYAIKHITKKNGDLMIPWRDQNPQCMNNRHRLNDVYLRIMNQSMGGKGDFVDSENKIIKKLSKAVYINKDC